MASDLESARKDLAVWIADTRRALEDFALVQAELRVVVHRARLQLLERELRRLRAAAGR
jgi:hypothetical protein